MLSLSGSEKGFSLLKWVLNRVLQQKSFFFAETNLHFNGNMLHTAMLNYNFKIQLTAN